MWRARLVCADAAESGGEEELPGAVGEPVRAAWRAWHLRWALKRVVFRFTGRRERPAAAPKPRCVVGSGWEQTDVSGPSCQ